MWYHDPTPPKRVAMVLSYVKCCSCRVFFSLEMIWKPWLGFPQDNENGKCKSSLSGPTIPTWSCVKNRRKTSKLMHRPFISVNLRQEWRVMEWCSVIILSKWSHFDFASHWVGFATLMLLSITRNTTYQKLIEESYLLLCGPSCLGLKYPYYPYYWENNRHWGRKFKISV